MDYISNHMREKKQQEDGGQVLASDSSASEFKFIFFAILSVLLAIIVAFEKWILFQMYHCDYEISNNNTIANNTIIDNNQNMTTINHNNNSNNNNNGNKLRTIAAVLIILTILEAATLIKVTTYVMELVCNCNDQKKMIC